MKQVLRVGPLPDLVRAVLDEWADWSTAGLSLDDDAIELAPDVHTVLVVSTTITEDACLSIAARLASRGENLRVGFAVGADPQLVATVLRRMRPRDRLAVVGGRGLAFLTDTALSGGLPGATNVGEESLSPTEASKLLREASGVVYLSGHSDGQCQGAGAGVALCQRDSSLGKGFDATHPCFHGSPCRFSPKQYVRVDTSQLSAQFVVSLTCFGYTWSRRSHEAATAVGAGILGNGRVRGLLTTMRAAMVGDLDFVGAYFLLMSGMPFGAVANVLNALRLERGQHAELLYFGDPDQQLPRTTVSASVVMDGEDACLVRPVDVRGPCDLEGHVPSWSTETTPVVLWVDEAIRAGMLAPGGRVFVSIPEDVERVTLRRVPLEEVRQAIDMSELVAPLRQLELLHRALAAAAAARPDIGAEAEQDLASFEAERASLLASVLQNSPAIVFSRRQCVSEADLIRVLSAPLGELGALVGTLRDVYTKVAGTRSFLWGLAPYYSDPGRSTETDTPCGFCGATVDEYTFPWVDERITRARGACRSCGTLYDRDDRFLCQMDCSTRVRAGSTLAVSVRVTNHYSIPVPASGALALILFSDQSTAGVPLPVVDVEAGEAGELTVDLLVPETTPPGTHRLAAAVCVGPSIGHLTRYIRIEPAA
jgi:hypothetical protein